MKKIIYNRPDGGMTVCSPAEGGRLAYSITLKDGSTVSSDDPVPVDSLLRGWPIQGATASWAETEDEFCARILVKDVPSDALNAQIVDVTVIPSDRSFRNAWVADIGVVRHDIAKCRELTKERLRQEREQKLAALDVEFIRAIEEGLPTDAIVAAKQALRDITDQVDAIFDLEEMKALKV